MVVEVDLESEVDVVGVMMAGAVVLDGAVVGTVPKIDVLVSSALLDSAGVELGVDSLTLELLVARCALVDGPGVLVSGGSTVGGVALVHAPTNMMVVATSATTPVARRARIATPPRTSRPDGASSPPRHRPFEHCNAR